MDINLLAYLKELDVSGNMLTGEVRGVLRAWAATSSHPLPLLPFCLQLKNADDRLSSRGGVGCLPCCLLPYVGGTCVIP